VLKFVVTTNMWLITWESIPCIGYTLRLANLVEMKITTGYIHEYTVFHLD
jgi:hypothetical protein